MTTTERAFSPAPSDVATSSDVATDPRPGYRAALQWVGGLMTGVAPGQLGLPTGCPDFDVRALLGHIVATVHRARVIGEGGDPSTCAFVVTGIGDDGWADAYASAAARVWAVWDDDARLTAPVTAPWGTVPGAVALWGYVNEALVHGFDLAVATGQPSETDPDVVRPVLAQMAQVLPAGFRGGPVPFAAVVEPAADAGPTERLANWSGRTTRPA